MKPSHLLSLAFFGTLFFVPFTFAQAVPDSPDSKNGIRPMKIGELDFYDIQDRPQEMGNNTLHTEDQDTLKRLAPTGKSPSGLGIFVVKKGADVLLIDTGIGGKLLDRLQTIGIKPEEVKNILLTHSHGDHVGGLVKDGQKVFPNATLWLDAKELSFWKSARSKDSCEQCLKLYGEPKFLTPNEKTAVIFPEMVAVDLAGHTPGHTGFLISSGGKKLLVAGDLLHSGAVQFARPDISSQYDSDPERAAEVRRKTLQRAADEKLLFVATHLPFPYVGYVEANDGGFRFMPVDDTVP